MHIEMNRTSTCHHSSVSSVDNYPIQLARSRRIIVVLLRVGHLLLTSQQRTQERFLTSPRHVRFDDTRKHKNTLSVWSSIYAFGLRRRPDVHLCQRGLRDFGVLSHEIVIVRQSLWRPLWQVLTADMSVMFGEFVW